MNEEKKNVLPEDFDGVFKFTNWTAEEFKAKWDSIEYTFPALSTIPLIIPNATPLEIQSIRKKFAKELAIEVFYQSDKFKKMDDPAMGKRPPLYQDIDLKEYIQKCLEPLQVAKAKLKIIPKDSEDNYKKDSKGRNISRIMSDGESLMEGSSEVK